MNRDTLAGAILLAAAATGLAWANSPFHAAYGAILSFELHGSWTTLDTINGGLMGVFFFVIGLELRQELSHGALSTARAAALPLAAACGGVLVPAAIYLAFNSQVGQKHGWAVPTATDIAFALGVLALLGHRVPAGVRILLLALAVIDDLLAVLVIAVFFSGGLHASLVGVAIGLLVPPTHGHRAHRSLQPLVAFGVMPLFALANAGIELRAVDLAWPTTGPLALGVCAALLVGKPLGVVGACWLAIRQGWCVMPAGVDWRGIALVGLLAGIGFTMAIFIATLAFGAGPLLDAAKVGVLGGSLSAAAAGLAWGRFRLAPAAARIPA